MSHQGSIISGSGEGLFQDDVQVPPLVKSGHRWINRTRARPACDGQHVLFCVSFASLSASKKRSNALGPSPLSAWSLAQWSCIRQSESWLLGLEKMMSEVNDQGMNDQLAYVSTDAIIRMNSRVQFWPPVWLTAHVNKFSNQLQVQNWIHAYRSISFTVFSVISILPSLVQIQASFISRNTVLVLPNAVCTPEVYRHYLKSRSAQCAGRQPTAVLILSGLFPQW